MTCTTVVPFPAPVLPGDNQLKANQVHLTEKGAQRECAPNPQLVTELGPTLIPALFHCPALPFPSSY